MSKTFTRIAAVAIAVPMAFGLTGCTKSVKQTDVENEISTKLEQQVGTKPDSVTCPGDLEGKQGTSMRCELTKGGQKIGLTVTVTDVQGKKVAFNIKIDDKPAA